MKTQNKKRKGSKMAKKMKYPKMEVKIETLTVALAKKLIASQIQDIPGEKQRKVKNARVKKYGLLLKKKQWLKSGEAIQIDWNGHMRNGGHRCETVVETGISIPDQVFVYGIDPKAFAVIDSGLPRMLADALHIRGEINCCQLQTALSNLDHYLHGDTNFKGTRTSFNNIEAFKLLDKYPNLRKSIVFLNTTQGKKIVTPSISSFLHYLCQHINKVAADEFFTGLIDGANLDLHSPIKVLRDALVMGKQKPSLDRNDIIAHIVKAWNKFILGKQMRTINWRPLNNQNEPMPRLLNCEGEEFRFLGKRTK
jgi:hypothetical protein